MECSTDVRLGGGMKERGGGGKSGVGGKVRGSVGTKYVGLVVEWVRAEGVELVTL